MGKRRFFDKESSFAEDEVVLSEVPEAEVVAWSETEPKDEQVEAKVSVIPSEPTSVEIEFAKGFKGTPSAVDYTSKQLAQSCASKGLLADFGTDLGYARGFKWHLYCK